MLMTSVNFSAGFDGFKWVNEFRNHADWSRKEAERQQSCLCFVSLGF